MKNKKLFAILTLVCFMFTLMPVAAFATADAYLTVGGEEDSKTVEAGDVVTLSVTESTLNYYFFMLDKEGDVVGKLPLNTTAAKTYSLDTTNYAGGSYEVYAVASDTQVDAVLDSGARYADKVDALFGDHGQNVLDSVALKVRNAENTYSITLSGIDGTVDGVDYIDISANNGFNGGVVTAKVQKNGTTNVKDAKLAFSTAGFVSVTPIDQVTGRDGEAQFKVSATKAGNYKVYVTYGDCTKVLNVNVDPVAVANVEVAKAPTAPVALDSDISAANVKFKFTDANGATFTNMIRTGNYNLVLAAKPADSNLETADVKLTGPVDGKYTLEGTLGTEIFDEEGDYTFRVSLQNGKSATATVSVKEYDKTVGIQFVDTLAKSVAFDSTTFAITSADVVAVDANGVTKAVAAPATIEFSVAGKAVKDFDGTNLSVKDEDYIGQTITVYAVYKEAGKTYTAAHELTVIDTAADIVYADANVEVAVNNVLYANVVDAQGNKVVLPAATVVQTIVLEKPATAIAVADGDWDTTYNRIATDLLVSEAGEYKVQTIATYTEIDGEGNSVNRYLTSIDTFTVGATKGEFKDVIVMSIGAKQLVKNSEVVSMPAAPEIVDSRTMVPARAGLEAFGAVVVWDEATRTVTAELNGVKVVMTIGEKAYTVNGKAMVGDAAPYITEASTMVPVSFFTNAFGIVATPIYDANGVCDVLFTK